MIGFSVGTRGGSLLIALLVIFAWSLAFADAAHAALGRERRIERREARRSDGVQIGDVSVKSGNCYGGACRVGWRR